MIRRCAAEGSRPRVEGAREAEILDATVQPAARATGYERLTMDAVAHEARASKATLYRRWTTKPALVVDALTRSQPLRRGGLPRQRLAAHRPGGALLRSSGGWATARTPGHSAWW